MILDRSNPRVKRIHQKKLRFPDSPFVERQPAHVLVGLFAMNASYFGRLKQRYSGLAVILDGEKASWKVPEEGRRRSARHRRANEPVSVSLALF